MTEAPNRATRLGMLNGVSAALQASHPPAAAPVPSPNAVASFWYPMTAPAAVITTPSAAPPAHGMPRECSSAPDASAPLAAVMVSRPLLPEARAVTTRCTSALTRLRRLRALSGEDRGSGGGACGGGAPGGCGPLAACCCRGIASSCSGLLLVHRALPTPRVSNGVSAQRLVDDMGTREAPAGRRGPHPARTQSDDVAVVAIVELLLGAPRVLEPLVVPVVLAAVEVPQPLR